MPFSPPQLFGSFSFFQETGHLPKGKKTPCQESANHDREEPSGLRLRRTFDRIKARQYLKVFHKKLISFFFCGRWIFTRPPRLYLTDPCQPGERSGNPRKRQHHRKYLGLFSTPSHENFVKIPPIPADRSYGFFRQVRQVGAWSLPCAARHNPSAPGAQRTDAPLPCGFAVLRTPSTKLRRPMDFARPAKKIATHNFRQWVAGGQLVFSITINCLPPLARTSCCHGGHRRCSARRDEISITTKLVGHCRLCPAHAGSPATPSSPFSARAGNANGGSRTGRSMGSPEKHGVELAT